MTITQAIKKEIRKQVHKVKGSHIGTVKHAFEIHFPSYNWDDYSEFAKSEIAKKYFS